MRTLSAATSPPASPTSDSSSRVPRGATTSHLSRGSTSVPHRRRPGSASTACAATGPRRSRCSSCKAGLKPGAYTWDLGKLTAESRGTTLAITAGVATLPGSQTRALWTLALFAAIQLADGALTAAGIAEFGPHIEGNPLIDFAARGVGIGVALIGAKLFAVFCGTL